MDSYLFKVEVRTYFDTMLRTALKDMVGKKRE